MSKIYKCYHVYCPGYPYPASELRHPCGQRGSPAEFLQHQALFGETPQERTMSQYEISNRNSGHILGTYTGETLEEALTAAAQDAGYRDHAHACEVTGSLDDLIVSKLSGEVEEEDEDDDFPFDCRTRVEITDDLIRALQRNAAAAGDLEMVLICQAALDGSESHRAECLRVLEATRAMED